MLDDAHKVLKQYWGYDKFRPLQHEIILNSISGNDGLAILPTGGGKSLCYQIPGLVLGGTTIVISPLIALMQDQVATLKGKGIKAACLHTGMNSDTITRIIDNFKFGDYRFLYVSPERLENEHFRKQISSLPVNLIAIDEAHCISQWGHEFRPSYLSLSEIKDLFNAPVLAVTATATPQVQRDIIEQLALVNPEHFQAKLQRNNLVFGAQHCENIRRKLLEVLNKTKGSTLIYARYRKDCEEISEFLNSEGIESSFYHAGLSAKERYSRQETWQKNECRVMVCTNAFGMGIDKADVRLIIHVGIPTDIESYIQEAGRAGRDGNKAFALLLSNPADLSKAKEKLEAQFPDLELIKRVYQAFFNSQQQAIGTGKDSVFKLNVAELAQKYNMNTFSILHAFKHLELCGYFHLSDAFHSPSTVQIKMQKNDLYDYQIRQVQFERLIKLLIRSYPGVFDYPVRIREEDISHILKLSVPDLIKQLKALNDQDVLSYDPRSNLPKLVLIQDRMHEDHLRLQPKERTKRLELKKEKLDAMISYLSHKGCRQQYLTAYFDEKSERCGRCDNCRNEIKVRIDKEVILSRIPIQGVLLSDLSDQFNGEESDFQEELRKLIDQGIVQLDSANLITKNV